MAAARMLRLEGARLSAKTLMLRERAVEVLPASSVLVTTIVLLAAVGISVAL